jgi:serine/threonine-protein kinase
LKESAEMIGTILGNRYELLEKIGEGGMAEVYKAKCHLLNRYVAVKILKKEFVNDEEFVGKFKREASSAAALSGTNIVNVYDVGSEEDINYIVMELIEGKTLKGIIREKGKMNSNEVLNIAVQIAKALECAHKNNIIHRDIKPQNILVTDDGVVKVTDFGIAKATDTSTITNTSKVIGTAHYFSPEQARGSFVDCRSDIYSLGIVIYEMVTGKVPYDAENAVSVALKHIEETVIPPKQINDKIPDSLNNLILKAIEKQPIKRYQTIKAMIEDLLMIENDYNYDIVTNDLEDDKTRVMEPVTSSKVNFKKNIQRRKKKTAIIITASLLVIVIGFLGGWIFGKVRGTGIDSHPKSIVIVPDIVGDNVEEAEAKVRAEGLKFVVGETEQSDMPKDTVILSSPNGGIKVESDTEVRVILSSGPEGIPVRDYRDLNIITVKGLIESSGLTVGEITGEYNDTVPKQAVIRQSPEPDTMLMKDDKIDLVVSKGPKMKTTVVPPVSELTLNEAATILQLKKLELGNKTEVVTDKKELDGLIFSQSIEAGSEVKEGTVINVSYYKYDPMEVQRVDVPKFVGMTVIQAKLEAEKRNIKLEVYGENTDIIKEQDKEVGSRIYLGETVKLTVEK